MIMNTTKTSLWRRLLALMMVFALLLCGCGEGEKDSDDEGTKGGNKEEAGMFGDGDGKMEPQDVVDSITNIYGNLLTAVGGSNGNKGLGGEMSLTVEFGQKVLSALEDSMKDAEMDTDLSWFKSVGMDMEYLYADEMMSMNAGVNLNGKSIVTAEVIANITGNMVYFCLPELNDQYVGGEVDFSEMVGGYEAAMGQAQQYTQNLNSLPTDKELNALISRYVNLMLDTLTDPTTEAQTLTVGGITKEATATVYVIRRSDVLNIAEAVLNTAKTDKELEKAMDAISTYVNETGRAQAQEGGDTWEDVDLHDQLIQSIDPALQNIAGTREDLEDAEMLQFAVYNAGDEQLGFRLSVNDGYDTMEMHLYNLVDGKNTAFELDVMGQMKFTGTGTINGSKRSGTYTLNISGQDMLFIELQDFDTAALNKGELKGTVRLKLGQALIDNMGNNQLITTDIVIELNLDVTGKKSTIGLKLYEGNDLVFGLTISTKTTSGGSVKVPSKFLDATSNEAAQEYLSGMRFDKVLSNLRSAGVPSDMVDMLENTLENSMGGGSANQDYPAVGYAA